MGKKGGPFKFKFSKHFDTLTVWKHPQDKTSNPMDFKTYKFLFSFSFVTNIENYSLYIPAFVINFSNFTSISNSPC